MVRTNKKKHPVYTQILNEFGQWEDPLRLSVDADGPNGSTKVKPIGQSINVFRRAILLYLYCQNKDGRDREEPQAYLEAWCSDLQRFNRQEYLLILIWVI